MYKILKVPFNGKTILGSIILCSVLLTGTWVFIKSLIGDNTTDTTISTYSKNIQKVNQERYKYEDSVYITIITSLQNQLINLKKNQQKSDSLINNFNTYKIVIYNEKIDNVNYLTDSQLLQQWANRYDK